MPQTQSKLTVDFSHRFATKGDLDFHEQTNTLVIMAERALSVLQLLSPEIEDKGSMLEGALDSVIAEVEDIKAFAYAMQVQGVDDER
jgi:hypothetical protein